MLDYERVTWLEIPPESVIKVVGICPAQKVEGTKPSQWPNDWGYIGIQNVTATGDDDYNIGFTS